MLQFQTWTQPKEELVMKKLIMVLMALLVCAVAFAALDFTEVDALYLTDEHDQEVYDKLTLCSTKQRKERKRPTSFGGSQGFA